MSPSTRLFEPGEIRPNAERAPFEVPPPLIPESAITHRLRADVVVVGAGFAGLAAAGSAAEAGAKVLLLEKCASPNSRGIAIASINSRQQQRANVKLDRDELVHELMRFAGYKNADQRVVSLWADHSGETMDWVEDIAARAGFETVEVPLTDQVRPGPFKYFPVVNMRLPSADGSAESPHRLLSKILTDHALSLGVEFHFSTPAVQLVRDQSGTIAAIIAKNADDEYVRIDVERGVILCAGDYGHNKDMMAKYAPHALKVLNSIYSPPVNTGDGHQMGLWVGAAMDEAPHCALIFDMGFPDSELPMPVPLTRQPFLNMNLRGERYVNEDLPYAYTCNADMQQPDGVKWAIWDEKWETDTSRFQTLYCKQMTAPMHQPKLVEALLKSGVIRKADTLEELVRLMGVPESVALATIKRYNDLARGGKDLDFGKAADCLSTIEQPPFYAAKLAASLLVTLGGLRINSELQVLDTSLEPIPGLYAAGNTSGSFFGHDYPINISGVSHGRALTFGRLAGIGAASRTLATSTVNA